MKGKVHLYINPRSGENVCVRYIDPDERYRWAPYMVNPVTLATCKHCSFTKRAAQRDGRKSEANTLSATSTASRTAKKARAK